MPERIKYISKQFLFTTEESKSSLLVFQPWVYFQSLKCGEFYGSHLFRFFLTFRLVQWKVLIFHCSQTSSCMFSTCLYLLEWKKSFHLSEISLLVWLPRQNFTEMWAPLKFLLFPVRHRFPSFLKKNLAFQGQNLPDTAPGHGLQLALCSYKAMQWVILALTVNTGHSDSWDIPFVFLACLLM